jgi:hypothetical protein
MNHACVAGKDRAGTFRFAKECLDRTLEAG